ncbi:hypothetical protein [Curtobacterium aetherium]|uniref:Uncharacterized protein n=1 Tax=Curtobacterium aetherium TaxID=2841594 RepID=A0ACD1E2N9_9MICO|nr:hypothetical protein [Curtobacterium sp. L6-1]QWS33237.1 hypothetical protein KM842_13475 [Curtobacterium sp. L6-1]
MTWSFLHPASHAVLGIAVLVFVATVAIVVPTVIAMRRGTSTDAVAWADLLRRDDGSVWTTDRVLRSVEASCRAAGVVFPGFVRASVGPTVRLDLAAPTVAPPVPWTATVDGRSWSAPMPALQALGLVGTATDRFATAVGLGSDTDGTVVVDLAAIGGAVALGGDRAARLAVAHRIADQVRTAPWSTGTTVLTVGIGDGELGPARSVSVHEAVATVAADATPGLLVVRTLPGGTDGRELARLLERPTGRWAVVALQPGALARWTLTCRRDGVLTSPELGTVRWVDVALSTPASTPTDTVAEPAA